MQDTVENYTNLAVGEILRRLRMQYRLSLAQVENDTRIRAVYLEALELSDFERLPGQVYVTGFVKVYSDYLGLDSGKMVELLKKQTGHKVTKPVNIFPVVDDEQKVPNLKITFGSAGLLVLILLGWKMSGPADRNDEIPPLPRELAQQMTAPQKPGQQKSANAEPKVKPRPHPVVLKAVQDVWLEIRDNNRQPIFSRVLKQGEEYWVPEEAVDFRMTTGNAGGLEMVIDGEPFEALGKTGEVRRNISLNPGDLKGMVGSALPKSK